MHYFVFYEKEYQDNFYALDSALTHIRSDITENRRNPYSYALFEGFPVDVVMDINPKIQAGPEPDETEESEPEETETSEPEETETPEKNKHLAISPGVLKELQSVLGRISCRNEEYMLHELLHGTKENPVSAARINKVYHALVDAQEKHELIPRWVTIVKGNNTATIRRSKAVNSRKEILASMYKILPSVPVCDYWHVRTMIEQIVNTTLLCHIGIQNPAMNLMNTLRSCSHYVHKSKKLPKETEIKCQKFMEKNPNLAKYIWHISDEDDELYVTPAETGKSAHCNTYNAVKTAGLLRGQLKLPI